MNNTDELMRDLADRMIDSRLRQLRAYWDSPMCKAHREQREREWRALPWYRRAWIVTTSKVQICRERLGEIVAGREFNDDY